MLPTFETGQYLIVDQISYRLQEPNRGDVVVFRLPQEPSRFLIKRLIGLPGETVKIEGEKILRN
jgi:signal peptidase I